tara:strand:+ start:681 stop:836 length:156 start_codon:yes stop_codon:yes gene_type:complete
MPLSDALKVKQIDVVKNDIEILKSEIQLLRDEIKKLKGKKDINTGSWWWGS